MIELTPREKKIIHIMHTLINKNLENVDQQTREQYTKEQFRTCGLSWNEQESTDIVLAINKETFEITNTLQKRFGYILGKWQKDIS